MVFIKFAIAIVCFEIFFWYFLGTILSLPSMFLVGLFSHLSQRSHKIAGKILLVIVGFLAFFTGVFLLSAVHGIGIGWIATISADKATYPIVYLIIAGISAFFMVAPSGESSIVASLISLGMYLTTIFVKKVAVAFEQIYDVFSQILLGLILILLTIGVVATLAGFFKKKEEVKKVEKPDITKPLLCSKCNHTYDNTWKVCLYCRAPLTDNPFYKNEKVQ